uniref:Alpha-D-phosphohexomutase alpha/beta/alpha domain-containing protein n=1 Tax=Oncorhynchus tshawytscha TaxID=74940 RepID=A0AAZ3QXV2_ONCTS
MFCCTISCYGELDLNCHATGDVRLALENRWTRAQIEAQDRQVEELRLRLCCRMAFGTAGLRAAMGVAIDMASSFHSSSLQGMYKYLARSFPDFGSRGIVVGCDTRAQEAIGCYSERLSRLTAAGMLCKDIPVFLFSTYSDLRKYSPYAVKRLGVAADVMVTASHNPKEDNGCKVSDFCFSFYQGHLSPGMEHTASRFLVVLKAFNTAFCRRQYAI